MAGKNTIACFTGGCFPVIAPIKELEKLLV
jgi:hypothetical protein